MAQRVRLTIDDLAGFPEDDGNRYELIDGELHVSTAPDLRHQIVGYNVCFALQSWGTPTQAGTAIPAPGVIFSPENAVEPDVVWVSRERLPRIMAEDGKLHAAPELAVEVLSPGATNARRDREAKRALYAAWGVREYWLIDWRARTVEVYRREGETLKDVGTLREPNRLRSPLLPGFEVAVGDFFANLPAPAAG